MTVTQFWDMHSGGDTKLEPWSKIYIEAPEAEAKSVFYARFRRNPDRVTCTCCGPDYSVQEYQSIEEATSYHRGKKTVEEYLGDAKSNAVFIRAAEIKPEERNLEVPEEGYVWR